MSSMKHEVKQELETSTPLMNAGSSHDDQIYSEDELKRVMKDYYARIYPTETVCEWLAYGKGPTYLGRREFSLTFFGDIFTRHKSFDNSIALGQALTSQTPEKFDVGAVYNLQPNKKMMTTIVPVERELVFDIDMSDYDQVRSCCSGKKICVLCWDWMSTAAEILRDLIAADLGYSHMIPVFSGRRGLHLWVCDAAARSLSDEERTAIVKYFTVVVGNQEVNITRDLGYNGPGLHPSLKNVFDRYLQPAFHRIFIEKSKTKIEVGDDGDEKESTVTNINCIFLNTRSCRVVWDAFCHLERKLVFQRDRMVSQKLSLAEDECFTEQTWQKIARDTYPGVIVALYFSLLYPRLDEKVSTRRDHLLKLPFCIHPGTQKCCVPLKWQTIKSFDPDTDAPRLPALLQRGSIPQEFIRPLTDMMSSMRADGVKFDHSDHLKTEIVEDNVPRS